MEDLILDNLCWNFKCRRWVLFWKINVWFEYMSDSKFDNLEPTHDIEIKIGILFLTLICLNFNKKGWISIISMSHLIAVYSVLCLNNVMNNFVACSHKNWLDCVTYRSEVLSSIFICLILCVDFSMSNFLCRIFYVQNLILLRFTR